MNYGAVSDNLRDTLVTNLADDGIRLTVEAKYKEFFLTNYYEEISKI